MAGLLRLCSHIDDLIEGWHAPASHIFPPHLLLSHLLAHPDLATYLDARLRSPLTGFLNFLLCAPSDEHT